MRSLIRCSMFAVAALAVIALCASPAFAQQPGGRGGRGGRGGFGGGFGGGGFGGGGVTALLQDEAVRTELDLVDEQISKLTEISSKLREDLQAANQGFDFGALRDLSEDERNARFAEIREKNEKVVAESQKEIDAVLLPHQRERLKQLQVQSQMRFGADRRWPATRWPRTWASRMLRKSNSRPSSRKSMRLCGRRSPSSRPKLATSCSVF